MATNSANPDRPGMDGARAIPTSRVAESPLTDHHAPLERALVDEFLRERGYTRDSVGGLPPDDRTRLLRGASSYASLRLAEIEARAHLVEELE